MDSDSDSTVGDIYEVERILDAKKKDGKFHYKVRWEGYGSEEDSWEPSDNLLTCQELVDRYWVERKEGYKKRGRKPKRLKEIIEDDSDGSDTEEGQKDQNEEESEMILPPQKRKRGRPPKQRILSEGEKQTLDRLSSSSPELSEENGAKKRRRRTNKDDEFSTPLSAQYLLLGCEIAPVGMTRQASKELALISLRKKQECESMTSIKSEARTATEEASSSKTKQDGLAQSEKRETDGVETKNVSSKEDEFEVIEISSQSTEEDEEQSSSQNSERVIKEYIVISSQSESEGEEEGVPTKPAQDSSKTPLKKNEKETSLNVDTEKDTSEKKEDGVGKKNGFTKLKKSVPSGDRAKKNNQCSNVDMFPAIDFSNEGKAAVSEVERSKASSLNTERIPEAFEVDETKGFNEHATDENSNQVAPPVIQKGSVASPLSKLQSLFKKSVQDKNAISGILDNNTMSDSQQKSKELSGAACNKKSNVTITSVSVKNFRENNDMEAVMRRAIDMDTSHPGSQDFGTAKRRSEKSGEQSVKGKARRTEGRPKSIRAIKKRLSIDSSAEKQENFVASTKSPISENVIGARSEALGKPEKQMLASTTADLLPMQSKNSFVPLMDGDLIGAIIQDSGNIDESKVKSHIGAQSTKKEGKSQDGGNTQKIAQDETEKFKPWDSGMEDISDGEDDLSDFEFDLDDFSPHSFFNDVEESNVVERTSSPVVEPLNLSWAALKQAIRESDVMQLRRALAVPGFNPDMIDTASGMTLLMWAATYGQDEIVKLLLRRGAGVNYTDQKRNAITALMHAAEQGFPETVQILLQFGAHINSQTTAGETALMRACKKGHKDVVEVLLKHGVDTKAQATYDLTAVQIALKNQHFEIQNLLSDHEESLASTLHVVLGKCLGTAGTLRLPLLMPYRCIAPGEKNSVTFTFKYDPSKFPQGAKVVLFCVRADFNGDEVCLSFGGDNGVRTVLFNDSIQYPLVQGNRSVYLLTPDTDVNNELTVQTHPVKTGRLIVCAANVSATSDSS